MSQEAEFSYKFERERRRELFLTRVRNKTQEFYQRYLSQYEDMCERGYFNYIPEEMARFRNDLNTISNILSNDPESARDISQRIGGYIHGLWGLGKEAKASFRKAEIIKQYNIKQEKEKAEQEIKIEEQEKENNKNTSLSKYYSVLRGVDSIVANFASNKFSEIKKSILSGEISSQQEVERLLLIEISAAKEQAEKWKEKKLLEQRQQSMISQIEEQQSVLELDKYEDAEKAKAIIDKLEEIKNKAMNGYLDHEDLNKQLREVSNESDNAIVDESARREMAIATCKWLKAHDFSVGNPKIVDGVVVIKATKPSGNKAQFKLTQENKMFYRLDGYEGQSCLKDISSAIADLESVYGFKISEQTIKWQNPDRILRQKYSNSSDIGGNS